MWPLELLLLVYFGYVVSYTLIFSVAGLLYKTPAFAKASAGKPAEALPSFGGYNKFRTPFLPTKRIR